MREKWGVGSGVPCRGKETGERGGGVPGAAVGSAGPGGNRARWSMVGCGRERGKRGGAAAGHRQVGPSSTVPGGAV
jgi:hypothetical protein